MSLIDFFPLKCYIKLTRNNAQSGDRVNKDAQKETYNNMVLDYHNGNTYSKCFSGPASRQN